MKKITFAKEQGSKPFNWNKFLDKDFTIFSKKRSEQLKNASDLASNWITCACGNQCAIIPRDLRYGNPRDGRLRKLGMDFSNAVCNLEDNYKTKKITKIKSAQKKCKVILAKIEERSAVIIKNILASESK